MTGFGGRLRYAVGSSTAVPGRVQPGAGLVAIAFALFVLVPFGVFLGTCARLSATTRDRRIAALRLLGVSARQAAVVNAVETGVVAGGGALSGARVTRPGAAPRAGRSGGCTGTPPTSTVPRRLDRRRGRP